MSELVDELIQICGLSLMEIALTKIVTSPVASRPLPARTTEIPQGRHIPVVYHQPGELLVVDKPADLVINSNDSSRESVQSILKRQFPDLTNDTLCHDFYFVHRLDYATSGLLCIPLNKKYCADLSRQFERREITKFYLAIVRGHVGTSEISIDIPVGEDIRYKTTNNKMVTSHDWEHCLSPRRCETKLVVLQKGYYETEFATKVLLKPITGRRHQLRVHLSEIGHPIVGDFTYSSHAADCEQDSMAAPPRMMLHAWRIQIPGSNLDLIAKDPFNALEGVSWRTNEVVNGLEEALEKMREL